MSDTNLNYPANVIELAEHLQAVYAEVMHLPAFATAFKNLPLPQQAAWCEVAKDVLAKVLPAIQPKEYPTF